MVFQSPNGNSRNGPYSTCNNMFTGEIHSRLVMAEVRVSKSEDRLIDI